MNVNLFLCKMSFGNKMPESDEPEVAKTAI